MLPVRTPVTNALFGSADGDVGELPVERRDGALVSTWELDDNDRLALAEGGSVELAVFSEAQPPVSLQVVPPYCPDCARPMDWSWDLRAWACAHTEEDDDTHL